MNGFKKILTAGMLAASFGAMAECPPDVLVISGEPFTGVIGPIQYVDGEIPNLRCPDLEAQNRAYILCSHKVFDTPDMWRANRVQWIVDAGATRAQIPLLVRRFQEDEYSVDRCAKEITKRLINRWRDN